MPSPLQIASVFVLIACVSGCIDEQGTPADSALGEISAAVEAPALEAVELPDPPREIYAYDEEIIDTTAWLGQDTFRILIHQHVALESTYTWQTGIYVDGRIDTSYYYDNEVSVRLERDGQAILSQTLQKADFAFVLGEEFVQKANLSIFSLDGLLPRGEGVRFSVGVFVPDSDVGEIVDVDVERGTMRLKVVPATWD